MAKLNHGLAKWHFGGPILFPGVTDFIPGSHLLTGTGTLLTGISHFDTASIKLFAFGWALSGRVVSSQVGRPAPP